ncbi:MAG: threonine synthase [Tenericutes bacterium HGW-Tenericutes-1]|jgi:threonine synthase|nr:MAG: threonine synthase [Tenericutes bacterium HGW-Tenericutes-1]
MSFAKEFECTLCHKTFEYSKDLMTCPHCGEKGILDITYDYELMKGTVTRSYFKSNKDYSMWRYAPLMSIEGIPKNPLKVGWTPLYPSNRLNRLIGLQKLFIKDEGMNPTQSLKDRASAVAIQKAIEANASVIACSSTGNAASSLAGNAARLGLKTYIFVPKRAPKGKLAQIMTFGSNVVKVDGDYKAAFQLSKIAINHFGWYNRNAAINPHLVEGKKTVAFEIAEQLNFEVTDWVVVSVGDGCTIASVYKGFYDLFQLNLITKIPKLLGVQAEGCAPFYQAWMTHSPIKESEESTIADSIAVGIPRNPVKALNAVNQTNGAWITASDQEILEAMAILGKTEGIFGEPAGVTGLAGLMKALESGLIHGDESVTLIVTGNGLKDTDSALKAMNEPILVKPDLKSFIEAMFNKEEEDNNE